MEAFRDPDSPPAVATRYVPAAARSDGRKVHGAQGAFRHCLSLPLRSPLLDVCLSSSWGSGQTGALLSPLASYLERMYTERGREPGPRVRPQDPRARRRRKSYPRLVVLFLGPMHEGKRGQRFLVHESDGCSSSSASLRIGSAGRVALISTSALSNRAFPSEPAAKNIRSFLAGSRGERAACRRKAGSSRHSATGTTLPPLG